MSVEFTTTWLGKMAFEMDVYGHKVVMDSSKDGGGDDSGPRPKPLMIAAMTGCTGMDVVSILEKMKIEVDEFTMDVQAETSTEHPKTYTKIHLIYRFKGSQLHHDNIKKAVRLSKEKYCGVIALMDKATELTYEVQIEDV